MTQDTVFIRGLILETVIGVYEWEREKTQAVEMDLSIKIDISKAAASDDLSDTINYEDLSERLRAAASNTNYQLLEALAECLVKVIETEYPTTWFKMRLRKPNVVPYTQSCGVEIERSYPVQQD